MNTDLPSLLISHTSSAQEIWNVWGTNDSSDEPPPNAIDAMQIKLMRWQRSNFGLQVDTHDLRMGLGLLEEFGELHAATTIHGDHGMIDGLGDLCVYAGQIACANRLALRPILELADIYVNIWTDEQLAVNELGLVGDLAHTVLKHSQKIRDLADAGIYRAKLVQGMARLIGFGAMSILYGEHDDKPDREDTCHSEHFIQKTYLEVGNGVVLKRNWVKNASTGA